MFCREEEVSMAYWHVPTDVVVTAETGVEASALVARALARLAAEAPPAARPRYRIVRVMPAAKAPKPLKGRRRITDPPGPIARRRPGW
jgi:hypothetical protein